LDLGRTAKLKRLFRLRSLLFLYGRGGNLGSVPGARQTAALGCVCLTFNLRGHAEIEPQHETVTREDNLRDLLAAY